MVADGDPAGGDREAGGQSPGLRVKSKGVRPPAAIQGKRGLNGEDVIRQADVDGVVAVAAVDGRRRAGRRAQDVDGVVAAAGIDGDALQVGVVNRLVVADGDPAGGDGEVGAAAPGLGVEREGVRSIAAVEGERGLNGEDVIRQADVDGVVAVAAVDGRRRAGRRAQDVDGVVAAAGIDGDALQVGVAYWLVVADGDAAGGDREAGGKSPGLRVKSKGVRPPAAIQGERCLNGEDAIRQTDVDGIVAAAAVDGRRRAGRRAQDVDGVVAAAGVDLHALDSPMDEVRQARARKGVLVHGVSLGRGRALIVVA